jgi:hypothetical protein
MVIPVVSVVENGRGSNRIMRICAVTILLVSVLILNGCATGRTGTYVEPSPEDISRIMKVGLHVKVERGFAVRLQYISNADTIFLSNMINIGMGSYQGARLAGASAETAAGISTGIGIAGAVISELSPDKRATRALKTDAAQINSADAIGYVLVDKLEATKVFPMVELIPSDSLDSAREHGKDTLLIITVRRWGLRPPLGSKYNIHSTGDKTEAQLELDVNLKLISSANGKILWERNEFHIDNKSYSLGDFKSQEGLLVSRMELALQLVCNRMHNEIYRMR